MRARVVLIVVVLALSTAGSAAVGQPLPDSEDLQKLYKTYRGLSAIESPRTTVTQAGYLRFLGAPRNAYFEADPAMVKSGFADAIAQGFVLEHGGVFGIKSQRVALEPMRVRTVDDRTYVRLRQIYGGRPVFGAYVNVQMNASGHIVSVLSDIMRDTRALDNGMVSLNPSISSLQAQNAALATLQAQHPGVSLDVTDEPVAMVYKPSVVGNTGPTRLVWRMTVADPTSAIVKEDVFVDAHSGEVVLHYSLIQRAKYRLIFDLFDSEVVEFPGILVRSEGGVATGVKDVDEVYDFLGDTYDFYFTEHGRDSIDDGGMAMMATVRYPADTAFWMGFQAVFGTGMGADDVVAHELTHGVTQYSSNLVYLNQSGAINESFSDVWGEFVDLTNGRGDDSSGVRWLLGEDSSMGAIRSMKDPTEFGDPDRFSALRLLPWWYDMGGVHINSGIGNKLGYLLADGDTFNGQTITGLGISKTADLFYEVQTNLLNPSSDYLDLGDALVQAAENLGFTGKELENVLRGAIAVEIKEPIVLPIRHFRALSVENSPDVVLNWKNPLFIEAFKGNTIRRDTAGFPALVKDAEPFELDEDQNSLVDRNLRIGTEYFYSLFPSFEGFKPDSSFGPDALYARVTAGDPTPDVLSEAFNSGLDLHYKQIMFSPIGDPAAAADSGLPQFYTNYTNYTATINSVSSLPVAKENIIPIPLRDDELIDLDFLQGITPFPYFGILHPSLTLAANGYILLEADSTYGASSFGSGNYPSYAAHFDVPRISFLFSDLSPSAGGEVWSRRLDDRIVITFENVPEYSSTFPAPLNTVQVELFFSGHIRFTYLLVNASRAVCGLSDGNGVPLDPVGFLTKQDEIAPLMSDLSELPSPSTLTLDPIPLQFASEGELVEFYVTANSPNGTPTLTAENLPSGATFESTGGAGTFSWQTIRGTAGLYQVRICARLREEVACQDVSITVFGVTGVPVAQNLTITPGSPGDDDVLIASYEYFHPDGTPEGSTDLIWHRNGALVVALINQVAVPPTATEPGDIFYFTVTPRDVLGGEGPTAISPAVTIAEAGQSGGGDAQGGDKSDVNGDGSVNSVDVQLVINAALGRSIGARSADVNLDTRVNASDIQLVVLAALR